MARYLGPKHKLCRTYGEKLCDSPKCPVTRRAYRPGQHGPKRTSRLSEYGMQLREKQKMSKIYRVLEKQFKGYFIKAKKIKGDTGSNLIKLLENRLDNVVYRVGIGKTRDASRQIVGHGHILVNGKKVDIPSYQVKSGDKITVKESSLNKKLFKEIIKSINKKDIPTWLIMTNEKKLESEVAGDPVVDDLKQGFNTALIIEFYSR